MSADERVQSMPPGSVTHVGSFSWPTGVGPVPFLGDAAPPGWYMLKPGQGSQVELIADYPTLFAMFGTRFGGDGVTTFGLPQAGLYTRGPDGTHALWSIFGEDTHQLSVAELATHGHAVTDPGHTHGVTDPGHKHNIFGYAVDGAAGGVKATWQTPGGNPVDTNNGALVQTGLTVDAHAAGVTAQNAGANAAHNNLPKTLAVNYIIKT